MDDQDEGGAVEAAPQHDELTPLDPAYTTVLRIVAALASLPLLVGAFVLELADLLPKGVIFGAVLVLCALAILRVPLRRYQARGYRLDADRLRVVRGVLFHADTVVPFARVQHIDVEQGPLERSHDLATLTVHTAGTHNASVPLPGLKHADALAMRETIRRAIGREEF